MSNFRIPDDLIKPPNKDYLKAAGEKLHHVLTRIKPRIMKCLEIKIINVPFQMVALRHLAIATYGKVS